MAWADVFGEMWFWAAAGLYWWRAAMSAYGAPRRLIAEAQSEPGAAAFARSLARYRLGAGNPTPKGLIPLRWPALGAAAAYLAFGAVTGDAFSLAALTAIGPIVAASLALEPRMIAALEDARARQSVADQEIPNDGSVEAPDAFAAALDQIWKARFAAVIGALALTMLAAIATRPG